MEIIKHYTCKKTGVVAQHTKLLLILTDHGGYTVSMHEPGGLIYWVNNHSDIVSANKDWEARVEIRKSVEDIVDWQEKRLAEKDYEEELLQISVREEKIIRDPIDELLNP